MPTLPRRLLRSLLNLALNWLVWTAVAFGGAAIWGRWMLRRSNSPLRSNAATSRRLSWAHKD